MPNHIIKLSYKDDIRRLTLSENEQNIKSLKSIVSELYNLDVSEFNIKYFDEDNDIITLGTDQDLHDAISFLSQNARYSRLYVGVRGEEYDFTQSSLMSSTYGQNSLVASRFMGIQPTGPDYAKLSSLMPMSSPSSMNSVGLPTKPTPLEQNTDKSNYSSFDKPIQNNNFYVPQSSYPPVPMNSQINPSMNPPMNPLMNPSMNPSLNPPMNSGVQPFSGQQESSVPNYPPAQGYPQPTFNNDYNSNNNIIPNEPKVQDNKPDNSPVNEVKKLDSPPPIRVPSPKVEKKPEPEYKIGEEHIASFDIILEPGATTTKNWTIINIGDCKWPNDLYLEYNNQKINLNIPPLEPGKKTSIDIAITAPPNGIEKRLYSIKHNNKVLLNLSPVTIDVQEEEEEEEEKEVGDDKYKNVSKEAVQSIVDMGFDEDVAIDALTESNNNFEVALDLLLNG